jgi:hypothetical protein
MDEKFAALPQPLFYPAADFGLGVDLTGHGVPL